MYERARKRPAASADQVLLIEEKISEAVEALERVLSAVEVTTKAEAFVARVRTAALAAAEEEAWVEEMVGRAFSAAEGAADAEAFAVGVCTAALAAAEEEALVAEMVGRAFYAAEGAADAEAFVVGVCTAALAAAEEEALVAEMVGRAFYAAERAADAEAEVTIFVTAFMVDVCETVLRTLAGGRDGAERSAGSSVGGRELEVGEADALADVAVNIPESVLRAAFAVFDKDGSGTISLSELKGVLCRPTALGTPFTEAQAAALLTLLDDSGDGEVSYHELAKGGRRGLLPGGAMFLGNLAFTPTGDVHTD